MTVTLRRLATRIRHALDQRLINPPRPVIVTADGILCPRCGEIDTIHEIDIAYRWNGGEIEIEDGRIVAMYWCTRDANFDHDEYRCGHCYATVLIPGAEDIPQDWI